jgi:hypothetical protein
MTLVGHTPDDVGRTVSWGAERGRGAWLAPLRFAPSTNRDSGGERSEEDVVVSCARLHAAAEVDLRPEEAGDERVAVAVVGHPDALVVLRGAEVLAPDVAAVGAELEREDVASAGADEGRRSTSSAALPAATPTSVPYDPPPNALLSECLHKPVGLARVLEAVRVHAGAASSA